MEIYGSNYLEVRNTYIIPLKDYGISRNKTEYWSLKDILTDRIISLTKLTGKCLEIEISKSDFYNGLLCDIELFQNKSIVQYSDFIKSRSSSPCWSFVTLYYLTFFAATCFYRFLHRGFIFLTNAQKVRLEQFSLAVYSEPLSLASGNYYFSYKEDSPTGNVIINLSAKGDNFHKQNWSHLENTFKQFLPSCDSDERVIYNLFLSHFSSFSSEFPSQLRNTLNYQGESSMLDIDNRIAYVDLELISKDFIKSLIAIDSSHKVKNQIDSVAHLAYFLLKLNSGLYSEYLARSRFGKDFQKLRMNYLGQANQFFL